MGLFDFLKKKDLPAAPVAGNNTAPPQQEPYLGDLEKTGNLFRLLQTPKAGRDAPWEAAFLENIVQASFRCGQPQVVNGPDGLRYFQLLLPEPNTAFECFVMERMIPGFLLQSGIGVVINPTAGGADWVLSYGDLLNLYLNGVFYTTTENSFSKERGNETLTESEEVMVGQPSEMLLPKQARAVIARFLKENGLANPKVFLLMRHGKEGTGISQDLVFNLTPEDFVDRETYQEVMKTLGWYLPRHYSYVGTGTADLEDSFEPL